jgi:cyclopropane fatty-acyl-phospholipid synthase-like methyltransferase
MGKVAWDELYREMECRWGTRSDHVVSEYAALLPDGPVLDLGIGEGRNSLPLGAAGRRVDGVDISDVAIRRCVDRAKNAGIDFCGTVQDLRNVVIPSGEYSLIIAAWVLNFFRKSEVDRVLDGIKDGIADGGLVYIGAFTTSDPGYLKAKEESNEVEENTFYLPERDSHCHFFTRDSVLSLFSEFKLIHCSEGTALDTNSGNPHYHGFIQYVGQKCGNE